MAHGQFLTSALLHCGLYAARRLGEGVRASRVMLIISPLKFFKMDKDILLNQIVIMEALLTIVKDKKAKSDLLQQIEWTKSRLRNSA